MVIQHTHKSWGIKSLKHGIQPWKTVFFEWFEWFKQQKRRFLFSKNHDLRTKHGHFYPTNMVISTTNGRLTKQHSGDCSKRSEDSTDSTNKSRLTNRNLGLEKQEMLFSPIVMGIKLEIFFFRGMTHVDFSIQKEILYRNWGWTRQKKMIGLSDDPTKIGIMGLNSHRMGGYLVAHPT